MNAVIKIVENSSNPLTIELPQEYENKKLEVIVLTIEEQTTEEGKEKKYDFTEFFGKLEWKGDVLAEQKRLRDEWE